MKATVLLVAFVSSCTSIGIIVSEAFVPAISHAVIRKKLLTTRNRQPPLEVSPFFNALGTLTVSAGSGYLVEQNIPNSGILTTLGIAALLSNTLGSPKVHYMYDMCWSTLLPMSLALLLFSLRNNVASASDSSNASMGAIKRLSIPFVIASIASLLGCLLSFALKLLPLSDSCFAASCLVASYIGGSVNFFATAYTIDKTKMQLASAMATADIFVMAFYFAGLSAALQSSVLKKWFGDGNDTVKHGRPHESTESSDKSLDKYPQQKRAFEWSACLLAMALSLAFVEAAKRVETILNPLIPGTACAFLATAIPAITNRAPAHNALWRRLQTASRSLSGFVFFYFFAAIGVSVDLEAILFKDGPSCVLFAGIALVVHGVVAVFGSLIWKRVFQSSFSLVDVLVSSNACIGGPATAATFCGTVAMDNGQEKRGLTIAATIWGVVGYALGTTIGVTFFRFLNTRFVQ